MLVLLFLLALSAINSASGDSFLTTDGDEPDPVSASILKVTLPAAKDTWLQQNKVNQNFGACGAIELDGAAQNDQGARRGLLQFDLSGIPPDAVIVSAQLKLTKTGGWSTSTRLVEAHRVVAAWDEGAGGCSGAGGQASWRDRQLNTPWLKPGGDYDPKVVDKVEVKGNGVYSWDLTTLVRQWASGATTNYGVLLGSPGFSNDWYQFASSENATIKYRPQLLIQYAPAEFVADDFDPNTGLSGNDGTLNWASVWYEMGENDGGAAGRVQVVKNDKCTSGACLRFSVGNDTTGQGIRRAVNLVNATLAQASFDLRYDPGAETVQIALQASKNGERWATVQTFTPGNLDSVRQFVDITPYATDTTQIRFRVMSAVQSQSYVYIDNVQIGIVRESSIGGLVWNDVNRNGRKDSNEAGIANVSVRLFGRSCGDTIINTYRTATTDANGNYRFSDLAAATYCVHIDEDTLPANFAATTTEQLDIDLNDWGTHKNIDFGYAPALAVDRLVVSAYAPCTDISWLQALASIYSAAITDDNRSACTFTLTVAPAQLEVLRQAVLADPHVSESHPDVFISAAFTPNDPDYNDPNKVYGPQQINAPAAWDTTTGDPNLIVGVIDTGIDLNHPEFSGRVLPGYDFVNNDADPMDDNGHGTHVAGIIAAGLNNGIGMAGMANVKLMPVKVLNASNTGWWSAVASGITYAVDHGAKVVNLSLAGAVDSTSLRNAVAYANSKGVTVVVAAGNSSSGSPYFPASYDNVISVGGTTFNGPRWSLSNFGPNVDVMAPGSTVLSTYWSAGNGSGYQYMSGTSMAAPHAAGVAALMLSLNPNLTPDEVKQILQDTAMDMGDPGIDALHGYGRVDAAAAVMAVTPSIVVTPTTALEVSIVNDLNGNGLADPGDTLRHAIMVANDSAFPLSDALINSAVPAYTSYVPNSTALNGIPVQDSAAPGSAFPLDDGGIDIGGIPAKNSSAITFDVIAGPSPRGVYTIESHATVGVNNSVLTLTATTPIAGKLLKATVDKASAQAGDTLSYTMTSDYLGSDLLQSVVITAPIPAGTTYIPGSANAGGVINGGSITWALGNNAPATPAAGITLSVAPTLITSGQPVTVTQVLTAAQATANVIPTLSVAGTNGASATRISGPTPPSATVSQTGTTFTWVYRATSGGGIGQLTFSGAAAGSNVTWPTAQSNAIIVHPPLTFGVTINDPPGVPMIAGTGGITDAGGKLPSPRANTVITQLPGSIGDRVWHDIDGNGIQEPNEPGIPGIAVDLLDDAGGMKTTVTTGDGFYAFDELTSGVYTVTVDANSLPAEYDKLTTAYPSVVTLGDGERHLAADIGLRGPIMAIGDAIWYDANADGQQDPGEPGLGNITIDLWRDDGDGVFESSPGGDQYTQSTLSDAIGNYRLEVPMPGVYFVNVTDNYGLLANHQHTIGVHSIPNPSPPITVALGESYHDTDFGYVRMPATGKAIIGDLVWIDGDSDGVKLPEESALIGVEICATPTGGGSSYCAVTDLNGRYLLEVPAGSYDIVATSNPLSLMSTGPNNVHPQAVNQVSVVAGEQHLGTDLGYSGTPGELGILGGRIWHDIAVNNAVDGMYDPLNESGIGNVSVSLVQDTNDNQIWDVGEPILATSSNAIGEYRFGLLSAGSYLVEVSDTLLALKNLIPTKPGPTPTLPANNHIQPFSVVLASGEVNTTIDFGYRQEEIFGQAQLPQPGIIGDQVWLETDYDGIYSPTSGDLPLAGITIRLRSLSGAPDRETTTNLDGKYLFNDLPLGSYQVEVSDNFGVLTSFVPTMAGPNPGQDNNNQTQPYAITLGLTPDNLTADFGYLSLTSVGDRVWVDMDADGVQDVGEFGAPNVTVQLLDDLSNPIDSTQTNANGNYAFTGLPPGAYAVRFYAPAGYIISPRNTTNATSDSDADPLTGQTAVITLSAGENDTTRDAGIYPLAAVSGIAFIDSNGDGAQNPGETVGVSNAQITATNIDTGAFFTTFTGVDGSYQIANIPAGNYRVEAPPNLPNLVGTTAPYALYIAPGDEPHLDFGFSAPTAVMLTGFTATPDAAGVLLQWTTGTEYDQTGFVVWRAATADGPYTAISPELPATNDATGHAYAWSDARAAPGIFYWYKLQSLPDETFFGPIHSEPHLITSGLQLYLPRLQR